MMERVALAAGLCANIVEGLLSRICSGLGAMVAKGKTETVLFPWLTMYAVFVSGFTATVCGELKPATVCSTWLFFRSSTKPLFAVAFTTIPILASGFTAAATSPKLLNGIPPCVNGTEPTDSSSMLNEETEGATGTSFGPCGSANTAWCVAALMPTPCTVLEIERLAITTGVRPKSAGFTPGPGLRPRSTIVIVPAPPGVINAQFNFGSTDTLGLMPVPMGASVPVTVSMNVGTPPEKSTMAAELVDWKATSPRCVNGLMPIAKGTGAPLGGVLVFGSANVAVTVCVTKSMTERLLLPLLVTTPM